MQKMNRVKTAAALALFAGAAFASTSASANPFALFAPRAQPAAPLSQDYAAPQPQDHSAAQQPFVLPAHLQRQVVHYPTREAPGTIIVDTPNTYLYLVLGNGKAMRYGIGVGREGFTWSGVKTIARKAEWPDWIPPKEMLQRQPYLPRFMAGGPGNPLGARAMYIGGTVYRIHGTNAPSTIGTQVSSGCIRLTNTDVADLYERVQVGAKVIVLPMSGRHAKAAPRETRPVVTAYAPERSAALASRLY